MERTNWKEVVDLSPQGYVELNNSETVVRGPVTRVWIDDADFVHIDVEWAAEIGLGEFGIPNFGEVWRRNDIPIQFPNLVVPFTIEDTPQKGKRVRFGGANILYVNPIRSNIRIGETFGGKKSKERS